MANGAAKQAKCIRVGTWNVWWAKRSSERAGPITRMLTAANCDILCVTEGGDADVFPEGGHVIDAGTDWGCPIPKASPGRRKVMLWSKQPWTPIFDPLQGELPPGRLVAGTTDTPMGRLTVVGICIPWRDAHVRNCRRDRAPWQDHLAWLSGFERLSYARSDFRTVVLGDFNQRTPKGGRLHCALQKAFQGLRISTGGFLDGAPDPPFGAVGGGLWKVALSSDWPAKGAVQLIDHIAHSRDLAVHQSKALPNGVRYAGFFPKQDLKGVRLSDHNGVWLDLKKA